MKDLQLYLSNITNKTGIIAVLLMVITFIQSVSGILNPSTLAIVNVAAGFLLLFFKFFAPSGSLPSGWGWMLYVSAGVQFLLGGVDLLGTTLVDPSKLTVISTILTGIFGVVQMLTGGLIPKKSE